MAYRAGGTDSISGIKGRDIDSISDRQDRGYRQYLWHSGQGYKQYVLVTDRAEI